MSNQREAVFNGGPFQSYWWADEHEPIHPAVTAELDRPVKPELLEKAWAETVRDVCGAPEKKRS